MKGSNDSDWKGELKDGKAIAHRRIVWQKRITGGANKRHCAISALIVKELDLLKAPCGRKLFLRVRRAA